MVWAATGIRAADIAAPPPPIFNTDSAVSDPGAPAAPAMPAGEGVEGSVGPESQGALPNQDDKTHVTDEIAAPQISEEQMIKNSMDIAYQLYHAEDYVAAGQITGQILDKYKKRKIYWVNYLDALCLEHQDLYEQAIAQYEKVRIQAPHSTYANAATFRIGICQMRAGHEAEAVFTLRDVIETHPRSEYRLQAYVHLGSLYRQTHEWKEAERIYQDLIRLYPDTLWAFTSMQYLAESYVYTGRPGKAVSVYDNMQKNPTVPLVFRAQAQLRIGEIHFKARHWQEAIGAFRAALRDYADVPGIALAAEGKIKEATEARNSKTDYKQARRMSREMKQAPEDESYRLKQEREDLPY